MKEVGKVPPRHVAGPLLADVLVVVGAEELHAHHGKDEDDDAEDKSLNWINTLFNKKCSFWAAAIALWFRLRYHPVAAGSNPKHTIYALFNLNYWNCDYKSTKVNKKRPGLGHLKNTLIVYAPPMKRPIGQIKNPIPSGLSLHPIAFSSNNATGIKVFKSRITLNGNQANSCRINCTQLQPKRRLENLSIVSRIIIVIWWLDIFQHLGIYMNENLPNGIHKMPK